MRPGVISAERYPARRPALHREHKAVVVCGSTGIDTIHRAVILRSRFRDGAVEHQTATLIRVRCRRTWIVGHAVECALRARNIDGRIDRLRAPQMSGLVSEIRGGDEPI